ncbi:MAG: DUF3006 domain-containing protein [Clostridia bacterium]|nr:DUF3006 domain-containing protein [Clostridia bacterium]
MIKKLTVDRVEGQVALCFDEAEKAYELPIGILLGASEGDIIEVEINNGDVKFLHILQKETAEKKAESSARLRALFNRGKK